MSETYGYVGIEAFIKAIEAPCVVESNFQSKKKFMDRGGPWSEGKGNWDATKNIWRNGWPEGVTRMREALGSLEPPNVKDRRRHARWGESGDEFSKERVLSGNYDTAWRTVRRETRSAPVPVRITVDVEAHASDEGLFWRGACAVLLAESLSMAGYPTQIMATSGADGMRMKNEYYRQFISLIVKDWDGMAYLPTLIATTGHTSFLRVGVFAHNIQMMPKEYTDGLGYSIPTDNEGALASMGFNEQNVRTVYVPRHTMSAGKAKLWITENVAELEKDI